MSTLILSALFGICFFLFGTSNYWQKHSRLLLNLGLLAVGILVVVSVLDAIRMPVLAYKSEFLNFNTYAHVLICFLNICLWYFLAQNQSFMQRLPALPEQLALLFFMMCGGFILLSANHLLLLFLGIETVSLPLYIFTGLSKKNLKSNEATLKYFLTGAFFTGILLMGIALIYGSTGTMVLGEIRTQMGMLQDAFQIIGVTLILAAFAFKVAAVPFHFWTPDVYEGAPTVYTSLMASIAKSFFVIAFIKVFHEAFSPNYASWSLQISLLVVLTLIISNITALYQNGIKRLMSYSSIAQAAFMLLAIYGNNRYAYDGLLIYVLSYSLAVIGIFAILTPISDKPISYLNGFFRARPLSAVALGIFLLSLIGIPLTGGFIGKYYMLLAASSATIFWWILAIAFIASTISAYYYLRVLNHVFFVSSQLPISNIPISRNFEMLLLANAAAVILLGIHPEWLISLLNY